MPLQIVRNDITKMKVDAVVNAAKNSLLGGGGVDGAIHKAAGPKLLEECIKLGGCDTGDAKITKGYELPAKYIIHTVGPVWQGGGHGEPELLSSCYKSSLKLAAEYNCESVAFPLISAGIFGYPKDKALRVADTAISGFLMDNDMTVYIVVYGRNSLETGQKLFADIDEFIDDNYVEEHTLPNSRRRLDLISRNESSEKAKLEYSPRTGMLTKERYLGSFTCDASSALEYVIEHPDESFSEMLLRKIDEEGLTDAQCYRKANIDRKLFSKIRSNPDYKPSKPTVIAFALALKLPLSETQDMLMKAGYALSHSHKFDLIIEYCITHGEYDVFKINEILFSYDQNLIGACS